MKLKRLGWGLTAAATAALLLSAGTYSASAEDTVYIPQPSYRTGPYSVNGAPFANGFSDYLHMLNARDGGVEGVMIVTEECEFGYKTDMGSGMLRKAEGGRSGRLQPPVHRRDLQARAQSTRGPDPAPVDGLRHERRRGWPLVSVRVQLPDQLLEPGVGLHPVHR